MFPNADTHPTEGATIHVAVMTAEILKYLAPQPGGRYIDATLGGATHTEELLRASSPNGRVLSFDVERGALSRAAERLASYGDRWQGVEENFRHIGREARERSFAPVDGILFDLGLSSDELRDPAKGLSFLQDGPLDMRLGPKANEDGLTAADIVNSWTKSEIEFVLREYGEERFAGKIADGIVRARKAARIIGTFDLVSVIRSALPRTYEHGRIHPATRTFQALRIAVNDEMETLREGLKGAAEILAPNGRMAVISFHSLEDRIVKRFFREREDLEEETKKPFVPTDEEITTNPRARSAKLRVARRVTSAKQTPNYAPHIFDDTHTAS